MLKLFKYFNKRECLYLLCAIVFIVAKVYLALKIPDYMSVVTEISEGSTNPETGMAYQLSDIWAKGGMMVLCALGGSVCSIIVMIFATRIAADFSARLREMVYRKVQSFSMEEMNRFSAPSLITRTTNDIQQIQTFIIVGLDMVFRAPITVIWVIVKAATKRWEWSLAIAVTVVVMVTVIAIIMILVTRKFRKLQVFTDNLNQTTRENLSGIRVVKAYNAEGYQERKFAQINDEFTKTNLFTSRTLALMSPLMSLALNFINLGIYWIGANIINASSSGEYLSFYSDMVVFISYGMVVVSAFLTMVTMFMIAPRASVSARRINEILDSQETMKEGNGAGESGERGTIEFRNVDFRYPDGSENVLSGISFKVNEGETVAIIGSTGCGKSSLVNLVSRLYDVSKGEVLVDGVDVREYRKSELAKKIGYASQKPVIFSGTIRENIDFGDNGIEGETVKKSLQIAQISDFVDSLEGGEDSFISQNGNTLSGGQKQRLSIARAISRNAEIYILDDSFSALDYRVDKKLRTSLKKEMGDVTFLIVAQRIGTIMDADRIIVLEEGKIVGQGTHKELMGNCPQYRQIAHSQLSKEALG